MQDTPTLRALHGATGESTTFLGLPACAGVDALAAPIAILGAACATPYKTVGAYCRNAPAALRRATAGVADSLDRYDFDSGGLVFPTEAVRPVDLGDLALDETDPPGNRAAIRRAIAAIRARGAAPVLLGGDDSVPIPMLQALGDAADGRRYTILQLDAHIDWRDEHVGERWGLSSTMRRASEMPHVERIVQVGARGTGSALPEDRAAALDWGAHLITAREFHQGGPGILADLIPQGSNLAICTDADAMDPSLVPGLIGRAPGGFSYDQMADIFRAAAARGPIEAMSFVEFMPERDVDDLGALTFARLITTALGVLARQHL